MIFCFLIFYRRYHSATGKPKWIWIHWAQHCNPAWNIFCYNEWSSQKLLLCVHRTQSYIFRQVHTGVNMTGRLQHLLWYWGLAADVREVSFIWFFKVYSVNGYPQTVHGYLHSPQAPSQSMATSIVPWLHHSPWKAMGILECILSDQKCMD